MVTWNCFSDESVTPFWNFRSHLISRRRGHRLACWGGPVTLSPVHTVAEKCDCRRIRRQSLFRDSVDRASAFVSRVKPHSAMTSNGSAVYSRNKMGPENCSRRNTKQQLPTLPTDIPCTVPAVTVADALFVCDRWASCSCIHMVVFYRPWLHWLKTSGNKMQRTVFHDMTVSIMFTYAAGTLD